jgi:hypothetical protein
MIDKKTPLFLILLILSLVLPTTIIAQEKSKKKKPKPVREEVFEDYYNSNFIRYDNHIYDTLVKTVALSKANDELAPPLIRLRSEDVLKLSFDILSLSLKNYQYTFIHCGPDWTPSPLHQAEFMDGFFENYITDYKFSMNTLKRYVHYNIEFPNNNINFKQSGNYLLMVFEENNRDKPILTRRFMVVEEKLIVRARVNRPSVPEDRNIKQKIDFSLLHKGYNIQDPLGDVKVAILQNYRWDNAITKLKPLFIRESELVYEYDLETMFFGGNEFRNFDIKTVRFFTQNVETIKYEDGLHQVYLKEAQPRGRHRYATEPDINGKFVIRFQEGWDPESEADYANVHFRLKYPTPVMDGNLYVFGALTDWSFPEAAKMKYDYETRSYYTTMLLKQGYYNFKYVFLGDRTQESSPVLIEGSYFEAENDYTILVYHREPTTNFFKLVGLRQINSRNTI